MGRRWTIGRGAGPALQAEDEGSRTLVSLMVPLTGSLLQTYGLVWLVCRTPWMLSLTWPGLVRRAAAFLLVTLAAHALAVWCNRRIFRGQVDAATGVLVVAIWPCVVWIPLLVLLVRESSLWMAAVPPVIAVSAVWALVRWSPQAQEGSGAREAGPISSVFRVERPPALMRAIAPAMATAVAGEAAVAALIAGWSLTGGLLLAATATFPVWSLAVRHMRRRGGARDAVWVAAQRTVLVFLLLAIAFMPYLRTSGIPGSLAKLVGAQPPAMVATPAQRGAGQGASETAYSGVVLLLPPKAREEFAAPVETTLLPKSGARRKPMILPFDGEYWYFKEPDVRPRKDAPVVRGDPTQKSIRSTDMLPLAMEAHQRLRGPMAMDCCREIRVLIHNADNRPGEIGIEVLLGGGGAKGARSLGELVLHSSEDPEMALTRPPVDETLTFPFPREGREQHFDEITVVVRPAESRARAAAHLAVVQFELVP